MEFRSKRRHKHLWNGFACTSSVSELLVVSVCYHFVRAPCETETNLTFKLTTFYDFWARTVNIQSVIIMMTTIMIIITMMTVRWSENRTLSNNDVDTSSELNATRRHFDSMIRQLRDDVTQLPVQVCHHSFAIQVCRTVQCAFHSYDLTSIAIVQTEVLHVPTLHYVYILYRQ